MELLIVLGLCFGAYELLGVFQGCFQYNEHPFPYQPNQNFEQSQQQQQHQKDSEEESESSNKQQESGDEYQQENSQRNGECETEFVEENFDSLKSENCSCYSIADDDTKRILNCTKSKKRTDYCSATSATTGKLRRKKFQFDKTISKFSLSTSLMSLNRDDLNVFHYLDDINNNSSLSNKNLYKKFDDDAASSTGIPAIHKSNNINNRIHRSFIKSSKSTINLTQNSNNNDDDVNFSKNFDRYNDETHSEIHPIGNDVDINNKNIFYISTTAT